MKKKICLAMCLIVVSLPGLSVMAQPVTVERLISGYSCMRLNLPREKLVSRDLDVPVYTGPSAETARAGSAFATLIVRSPLSVENGFVQIMLLNGHEAWIQRGLVKPYATAEAPSARCAPAVMSNGRIGLDVH